MLWFVLAGMAAFAVLAALWPLLRPSSSAKADAAANEAAFYKAQLEEIRRDVERGLLPQGEADSARAEAARRLIAAASGPSPSPPAAPRNRLAAAALIAVGLPAIAFPLYALLGQPRMPDEPLASRTRGAADQWRDRGGGRGGRGAAHRQARRRQGLGGDRAGLYAPRALRRRRARLCRGAPSCRRGPVAPRRLRRGSGRRGGRRRHRRGAPGVRSRAGRTARPAAGAVLSRARRRAGRQEGRSDPRLRADSRRFAAGSSVAGRGRARAWRRSRASRRRRKQARALPPPFPKPSGQ